MSVICDGKTITPEIITPASQPALNEIGDAGGRSVIYQFTASYFECWDSLKYKIGYQRLKTYHLPLKSKLVIIKYRIRYPDKPESDDLTVYFVSSADPTYTFELPNEIK